MESNNTNQEYFDGVVPLAEPHFDEEATVLSARPVVPLKEIKAERSVKRLFFGLAIAGSLMLGALATSLIYKRNGSAQSTPASTVVSGAAGIAVEDPPSSAATMDAAGGVVPETTPQIDATTANNKPTSSASHSATSTLVETKRRTPTPQLEENELTRAERIEERRLRRKAERQARRESAGRQRRSGDDLLRIRDIFEGPSRP